METVLNEWQSKEDLFGEIELYLSQLAKTELNTIKENIDDIPVFFNSKTPNIINDPKYIKQIMGQKGKYNHFKFLSNSMLNIIIDEVRPLIYKSDSIVTYYNNDHEKAYDCRTIVDIPNLTFIDGTPLDHTELLNSFTTLYDLGVSPCQSLAIALVAQLDDVILVGFTENLSPCQTVFYDDEAYNKLNLNPLSSWIVSDNDPTGASVSFGEGSINFDGSGIDNAYQLPNLNIDLTENPYNLFTMQMDYTSDFTLTLSITTNQGIKYIEYGNLTLTPSININTYKFPLDYNFDGIITFVTNFVEDLKSLDYKLKIFEVIDLTFRGNGSIISPTLMSFNSKSYSDTPYLFYTDDSCSTEYPFN